MNLHNQTRTDATQLPDVTEVKEILEKEAKRKVSSAKTSIHYANFESVIRWLSEIGMDPEMFSKDLGWKEVVIRGGQIADEVAIKTLEKSPDLSEVEKYLGEEDVPQRSDVIFVFGTKKINRIEKAVELYKKGLAPNLFLSGGHPNYEIREPEALVYRRFALENGVPRENIFTEPDSVTIADNVRRSLNKMDELEIKHQKIILVNSWFVQRRGFVFMKKYVPEECKLFRVNAPMDKESDASPDRWQKSEKGIKIVFNEFVKMKTGVALDTC